MGIQVSVSLFLFAVSLLGLAVIWIKRHDAVWGLRFFAIGLFFADLSLLCALEDAPEFPTAIMNTLQLFTLNPDYSKLMQDAYGKEQNVLLVGYFTSLCILTPLAWGGSILTFFSPVASTLRFLTKCRQKSYFFSELTENTLALAESIYSKNNKKGRFAFFCSNDETNSGLKEKARSRGFILAKKSETELLFKPKRDCVYFELSENREKNFSNAKQLVHSYMNRKKTCEYYATVKIIVLGGHDESGFLFSTPEKSVLPVITLNQNRFIASNLLFFHPLYKGLRDDERTISVLIVGAGNVGMEIAKTALYCGQLGKDYDLKITIIDKHASSRESRMRLSMPEIFNGEYNLTFIETDVSMASFEQQLDSQCQDANYICVCLGDDDTSIETAAYLRVHYLRQGLDRKAAPFIAVRIKNRMKNNAFSANGFIAFGGDDSIYSEDMMNSELEKLAVNAHQIYSENKNVNNTTAIYRDYYSKDDVYIKSNLANALHIRYKLFLLGYEMQPLGDSHQTPEKFSVFSDTVEFLAQVEHDRWNAFMRTEGWRRLPLDRGNKKETENKIPEAKLHACLCPWEELDSVNAYFNEDFKDYDRNFIKYIPRILGSTNESRNISNVQYTLVAHKCKERHI